LRLEAQVRRYRVRLPPGVVACAYCGRRAAWFVGPDREPRCDWHTGGPDAPLPRELLRGGR